MSTPALTNMRCVQEKNPHTLARTQERTIAIIPEREREEQWCGPSLQQEKKSCYQATACACVPPRTDKEEKRHAQTHLTFLFLFREKVQVDASTNDAQQGGLDQSSLDGESLRPSSASTT